MAKKPKLNQRPEKRVAAQPATPLAVQSGAGFTTTNYEDVKKLHAAGISAVNSHGKPMVFEYAADDHARITAVLGG